MSSRGWVFATIVIGCAAGTALYLQRTSRPQTAAAVATADAPPPVLPLESPPSAEASVVVFLRQAGTPDGRDGAVGVATTAALDTPRFQEALHCDRVHMSHGRGICLERKGRFPVRYVAVTFDATFNATGEIALAGAPSRAQVSPDGRYAGVTAFVSGHSYAELGFSTRASVLDLETGQWVIEDLETFTVRRDGRTMRAVDFNFWGITFANDGRTFYATLGTGGRTYLVRGQVGTTTVDVIEEAVECPSISPDNRRIAFKERVDSGVGPMVWHIAVLDLETRRRVRLTETRGIDDQVQWLDDGHILYSLPGARPAVMDTWVVPADGSGRPRLLLPYAYSAGLLR